MGNAPSEVASEAVKVTADQVVPYDKADGPFWSMDKDGEAKIRQAKEGVAAMGTELVTDLFKSCAEGPKGGEIAMGVEYPVPPLDANGVAPESKPLAEWRTWTYKQFYDDCYAVANAFIALGHEQHDAVTVFGFNSPFWFMSEMGAIMAAGKAAGIYPSDTAEQVQFKSFHSDAAIACCEGVKQFKTFESIADRLPHLKAIVVWNGEKPDVTEVTRADGSVIKVLTWDDLIALGKEQGNKADERLAAMKPGHPCGLIYTSGTTGNPKAVMITHDNLLFESSSVLELIKHVGAKKEQERIISYLPLSHVAGMMVDIMCPIVLTAKRPGWFSVYFARPYDLKASTIGRRLVAIRPTIFLGVPRVWEKVAEKLKALGARTKGIKKKIATFAKKKGLAYQENMQLGGNGKKPGKYGIADKLVLSKIKDKLGLDQCKFGFSGAAPMTLETLQYFGALGINVNEVYGMSECTGATTWSTDQCHQWGSVGFAMPGMEVKIFAEDGSDVPQCADIFNASEAEQGEICFRGRHIMLGYLANPKLGDEHVEEIKGKNEGAIDENGWLHSGDKGCMSKQGMVKITGRYKELIIGAGGENVAPVPIEDEVKKLCGAVSNIMMIGNKRKFNVALITLKANGTGELPGDENLEGAVTSYCSDGVTTIPQAMKDDKLIEAITDAIKKTNANGAVCPSNAAKIQKFTILKTDFSVQTEELTATLKLKRSVVEDKHTAMIDKMYESKETYVPYE